MEVTAAILVIFVISIITKRTILRPVQLLVALKWDIVENEDVAEDQDQPMQIELKSLLL